jgi:hypothetical protein
MLPVLLTLLLQSTTISGSLASPVGLPAPGTAQVVLLPMDYANMFNAEAQQRIDRYWETFKPSFADRKELFFEVAPMAYRDALEVVVSRMRRDSKLNASSLIRNVPGGQFEFRGVAPGYYKIVAIAPIRNTDYIWTESLEVASAPIFLTMKNRVP